MSAKRKQATNVREAITAHNAIAMYLHCKLCLEELPKGESPMSYQRVQVGWTKLGLQVWCRRHECNVLHVDFEGVKHPANIERAPRAEEIQ